MQQPTCGRCQRAKIVCKGAGERRFKFLDSNKWAPSNDEQQLPEEVMTSSMVLYKPAKGNESYLLAQSLIAQLRPDDDLRYSITWIWGGHLADLPCRIGKNSALDAAVAVLLEVHHDYCTFASNENNQKLLENYTKAIRAVRLMLQDEARAREAETLCAIMTLSLCSTRFDGPLMNFASLHGRGAAELLKLRGFPIGRDSFESTLYNRLRGMVALQTIVDDEIQFNQKQWRAFEHSFQGDQPLRRLMRCVVLFGELMVEARDTLGGSYEEQAIVSKATRLQGDLNQIILELQFQVYDIDTQNGGPSKDKRKHAENQRNYCQALTIAGKLLCVRRSLATTYDEFDQELNIHSLRLLRLAEEVKVYRPLGANWLVLALMTTWCATSGTSLQLTIEEVLNGWRRDTLGERAVMPRAQLEELFQLLTLGRGRAIGRIP